MGGREERRASLAVEVITSDSVEKDYREAPERYAELGTDELVVFDPDFERRRWQRFRKLKRGFARVESTLEALLARRDGTGTPV